MVVFCCRKQASVGSLEAKLPSEASLLPEKEACTERERERERKSWSPDAAPYHWRRQHSPVVPLPFHVMFKLVLEKETCKRRSSDQKKFLVHVAEVKQIKRSR